MFLLQSFWGGLNFLQWSEILVDEIDLSYGLDAFMYEIDCVANDGLNLSIGAASIQVTLLGGVGHLKNDERNLSIAAASFDALLDNTEHFNELQVIYIYLNEPTKETMRIIWQVNRCASKVAAKSFEPTKESMRNIWKASSCATEIAARSNEQTKESMRDI